MYIKGKIKRIKRENHPCPDDGIHRKGKDNNIKGVKSIWIRDALFPRGSVGIHWRYKQSIGIKVYVGFPTGKSPWVSNKKVVYKALMKMRILHKAGLSPEPMGVEKIRLNVDVDGHNFRQTAYGLKMQHVYYNEKLWLDYALGRPYVWGDEPGHNPEGYLKFAANVKSFQKRNRFKLSAADWKDDEVPKLGDIIYCTKTKRWWLCDVD